MIGLAAIMNLYRITNRWDELLAWQSRHREEIERNPHLFQLVLRALGETGDVRGLVEFYDGHRQKIGRLVPTANRDVCRLMLFAFCGKRQAVERLFAGSLAVLPAPIRAFWLATADLQAGASESAKRQLEELLPGADPLLHRAIERRLSRISVVPEPLDAAAERVVEEASREQCHERDIRRSAILVLEPCASHSTSYRSQRFRVHCGELPGWRHESGRPVPARRIVSAGGPGRRMVAVDRVVVPALRRAPPGNEYVRIVVAWGHLWNSLWGFDDSCSSICSRESARWRW